MDINKKLAHRFYQNLGKLFYAIAAVDGSVRAEELDRLNKIVEREWQSINLIANVKLKDEHSIVNTFKWLHDDNEYNAEVCYNSFIAFKNSNEALFTSEINSLILKTARTIAAAFSKVNKAELILLARLDIELKKT